MLPTCWRGPHFALPLMLRDSCASLESSPIGKDWHSTISLPCAYILWTVGVNFFCRYISAKRDAVFDAYSPYFVELTFSLQFKTFKIVPNLFTIWLSIPVIVVTASSFSKNLLEVFPSFEFPYPCLGQSTFSPTSLKRHPVFASFWSFPYPLLMYFHRSFPPLVVGYTPVLARTPYTLSLRAMVTFHIRNSPRL